MGEQGDAVLRATELVKVYGKPPAQYPALRGVNLTINRGDCIAIVGKSGSGKSTLMHLLALLDTPTSGGVEINGVLATDLPKGQVDLIRNRSFGFVFQQFYLNARRSVLDNVTLPLMIGGTSKGERDKQGREALERVGLGGMVGKRANDLSGGEKQRVVIARALVNRPQVIFADEPTGNLDTVTGGEIEDMLFDLNKNQGITILFVTHDPELAARCPRSIELRDGLVVSERSNS